MTQSTQTSTADTLLRLAAIIDSRKGGDPDLSYVSRLFHKGEESGNVQKVHELRLDCDNDVILLKVEQLSRAAGDPKVACHTGRHSCFFQKFEGSVEDGDWLAVDPVLKDPEHIYK